MMDRDNLGCGHCGCPLDLCDCGADYEISYQPQGALFYDDGRPLVSPGLQRLAAIGAGVSVLLVAAVIYCL